MRRLVIEFLPFPQRAGSSCTSCGREACLRYVDLGSDQLLCIDCAPGTVTIDIREAVRLIGQANASTIQGTSRGVRPR